MSGGEGGRFSALAERAAQNRPGAAAATPPVHMGAGIHQAFLAPRQYSFDPPLREPRIKRTEWILPPWRLRDGRFQVETAHLPLQNVIFALFRGPGWLREQSTSESSVLLMVGRNCSGQSN